MSDSNRLPQLAGGLLLTDGGLETTLVFHDGIELPAFAAFDLLKRPGGRERLRDYFALYIDIARRHGTGIVLESVTWRANPDWGAQLGYSEEALAEANRDSIRLLREVRAEFASEVTPVVISGCIGPRGDGYVADTTMTPAEAAAYHRPQIAAFRQAGADMAGALTMTNVPEAVGIVHAAREAGLPVAVSFTVETDGRLPSGQSLRAAIEEVDRRTADGPAYYMINCAHPTHFESTMDEGASWTDRIRGLRANASCMSHEELDASEVLDDGNPVELGAQYREIRKKLRRLAVVGGCCGTDHRHVEAIAKACLLPAGA